MAKKEFTYRGKSIEELKTLSITEIAELFPARPRRSLKRGLTDQQKILMKNVEKGKKNIETHCRDMVILPVMVGQTIKVHSGKIFQPVMITEDMIGHFLGEFALTRKRVGHNAPGVGATRSSASVSVR